MLYQVILDFKEEYDAREAFNDLNARGFTGRLAALNIDDPYSRKVDVPTVTSRPQRNEDLDLFGLVEKYLLLQKDASEVGSAIFLKTGMDADEFIEGARAMLAPIEED